jgi:transposase InsO family protein
MDFIGPLPETSAKYNAIVVFVDRLSKMIHAVPTTTTATAADVAKILFDTVFRHHGLPVTIVSDRDARFTSGFWRSLFNLCGTHLAMSSAYHPQTDGQTERANRTLQEMLRAFVNRHQNDWDTHLTACEFAYNNSVNPSTGYSPFYLNSGRHPHTPMTLLQPETLQGNLGNKSAIDTIDQLRADLASAKENLAQAQARQRKYADRHRRDVPAFTVGDMVLVNAANLRAPSDSATPGAGKLRSRFIGPYPISKVISPVSYHVDLPTSLRLVHPAFHISALKPWRDGSADFPDREPEPTPPPPVMGDFGELEWTVEEIREKRRKGRGWQYLVKWLNCPEVENSWEPARRLKQDVPELVAEYDARHPG